MSDSANLPHIANELEMLQPKSVRDLGVGGGMIGWVVRNYVEGRHGRCRPDQWTVAVSGVEAFPAYNNPVWQLYDVLDIEDFGDEKNWHKYVGADIVTMIDSLEHLPKGKGELLIDHLVKNNKNVMVSVPLGFCPQMAVFNNQYEVHRAQFDGREFQLKYGHKVRQLHRGVCLLSIIRGDLN